jgi:hypothetical protein
MPYDPRAPKRLRGMTVPELMAIDGLSREAAELEMVYRTFGTEVKCDTSRPQPYLPGTPESIGIGSKHNPSPQHREALERAKAAAAEQAKS